MKSECQGGQKTALWGAKKCIIVFAGQYYDQETGQHYNYHRYYDPSLGRYLRADPIGLAGGVNLYSYVQNNPINFIDPNGLKRGPGGILLEITEKLIKSIIQKIATSEAIENIENTESHKNGILALKEMEISRAKKSVAEFVKLCDDDCIGNHPTDECARVKCHERCTKKLLKLRKLMVDPKIAELEELRKQFGRR